MGWIKKIEAPHGCFLPDLEGIGSTWKCDECGTVWEIIDISPYSADPNNIEHHAIAAWHRQAAHDHPQD